MILENKFIREKKQKKHLIMTILIIFFLLFFSFILLFTNTQHSTLEEDSYVSFSGILTVDNNYPLYTHLLDQGSQQMYVKSTRIDLNAFVGKQILVKGHKIEENNSSVLDVALVYAVDQRYILRDKQYIFPKKFFLLDINDDENLSVKVGSNTVAVSYDKMPAFTINAFVCNKIIPNQDCGVLRKNLVNTYVKSFTSPLGYQFLQGTGNVWYVLEKDTPIGYRFSPSDAEYLVNLSYIFHPLDGKLITHRNRYLIERQCLTKNMTLSKIKNIKKQHIKGGKYLQLALQLSVKDMHGKTEDLTCDMLVDLWDTDLWFMKQ
ncbi:MAG: hypothetical protein CR971_00850 [candidate division SR1 bacterium]|nr:MAG: hypothetical protein CR971_00850 [candidate division SR1 bacterium]